MTRFHTVLTTAALACALAPICTIAQTTASDPVLVESSKANVTRSDFSAELQRLPPDMRGSFATDPKRVGAMIDNILTMKQLAVAARASGIDNDPVAQRRLALEHDRVLAQLQVQRFEEEAGADFDARKDQFLLKAKERYAIDKEKYRTSNEIKLSHILFDTKKQTPDAALALARDTRAKVMAGADFATLARELSDDPATRSAGGALPAAGLTKLDPTMRFAIDELKTPGDITEPVLTSAGYQLIRLDTRHPARQLTFEEASPTIMTDLRKEYVDDQRELRVTTLHNDPTITLNRPAIDALIVRMPDPIMLRPSSK
jgi:peptidyl-prolyl cis-trans isomerase C